MKIKLPKNYLCAANYARHADLVYSPRLGRCDDIPALLYHNATVYFDVSYASRILEWVGQSGCKDIKLISAENDWHVGPQGQFYTNDVEQHGKCLTIQPLPDNVIDWATPNPATLDYPMRWIPLGIQNPYTKAGITKEIIEATEQLPWEDRVDKYLVCFNVDTYPRLRKLWLERVAMLRDDQKTVIDGPFWPEELASLMGTHKYVICPKGNGSDTHRIYEALYLGAQPIVDKHHPINKGNHSYHLKIDKTALTTNNYL